MGNRVRPGTHYPHVTWAHVMLRVKLRCERRFNTEFYGADSHFLSLCLRHVISRGAVVGSRASTPLKFLLSHTFRETWRTCRALFRLYQLFPEMEKMLIEKVRQRTFLYDTKSPDYRDQHMRANAWEGIWKELKIKRKFYVSSRDVRIVCPGLKLCKKIVGKRPVVRPRRSGRINWKRIFKKEHWNVT